jgi:cell division protein FtsB
VHNTKTSEANMSEDYTVRSSLDFQIQEAKSRAELFAKSLQDARAQEAIALKLLEEERERWTHSFEEKSILIEQLERELTSTVEALDVERSADRFHRTGDSSRDYQVHSERLPRSSEINTLSDAEVGNSFHNIMSNVSAHLPTTARSLPQQSTPSALQPEMKGTNGSQYTAAPSRQQPMHPPSSHYEPHPVASHARHHVPYQPSMPQPPQTATQFQQQSAPYQHHIPYQPVAQSPQNAPPHTKSPVPAESDSSVWRDLLAQYQEQLRATKADLSACSEERDRLVRQVERLERGAAQLAEEKELFAKACEHAEGKLKFRVAQVRTGGLLTTVPVAPTECIILPKSHQLQIIECEEDKEKLTKRVTELSSLNSDLQAQMSGLRHELAVANTELRVHANRNALRATVVGDAPERVPSAIGFAPGPSSSRVTEESGVQTVPLEATATSDRDQIAGSSNASMTAAARRSILATEAYVKDLQRQ